nr:4197_t:CDS:2 [Entrophospora candida]
MHPYFVASIVVSVAVVGFVAYTVYNEILNEPIPVYSIAGGNRNDSKDSSSEKDSDSDSDLSDRNATEERIEEQLLENLSYLNILEQELHRKSKEIENEERILKEREQELENRKQRLKSISSKSSSDSDLSKNTKNTSATNTILDNDSNDEIPLKDVEQHSLYNESSLYPDTAVQSILSQGLSSISSHHLQSSQQNQQHLLQGQILDLPNNSRFLSPNPSEDAWSEIGSIISEDVGSEMSSAVDIDMEETQILIWAQPVLIPFFMIHSVRLTYILIEEQQNSQYNGPKFKLPLVLNVYQGLLSCSAPIFTLVEAIATSMLILEIRHYVKETLEDEDLIHNKVLIFFL